jgi:ABC-2 type transport system ATP-binding protein/lipopolysaccharide transport system ATP-binding protein
MRDYAIIADNVSMKFNLEREKHDTLKEHLIAKVQKKAHVDEFYALRNISFEVERGDSFALVGSNGSGKSTVLKVISRIYKPTEGTVTVNGSVAPMIELGAGFDAQLTASENIFLNGAVLGYNREFMRRRYDEILEFAELWEFEHVPVKNYSSGMKARLGFAIATMVKADILIVDEVLAVGDYQFREKCERRIADLLSGGTTLLLVSHSKEQVLKLCKRAAWIEKGALRAIGAAEEILKEYQGASL